MPMYLRALWDNTHFLKKNLHLEVKKIKLFLRKERKSGYKYILKNRVKNNRKTFEIPTQRGNNKNLSVVFYSLNTHTYPERNYAKKLFFMRSLYILCWFFKILCMYLPTFLGQI